MRSALRHLRRLLLLSVIGLTATPGGARAQFNDVAPLPLTLQGVGVDEHLNIPLPMDLHFTDDQGRDVALGSFFDKQKKPVVLQLGYFGCPKLCGLVSHGLVDSAKVLGLKAGTDYDMIFLSIAPSETPTLASQAHAAFVKDYGRPDEAGGFHFLVGEQSYTQDVADATGFRFKKQPGTQLYAHPAVIMICTPQGRISRYLYGIDFPTETLKLSLVEASNNKIGSTLDHVLTFCYDYDAKSQTYKLAIWVMRTGGILTMLFLGSGITWLIRRDLRTRH